jgi:prepilin-type N-terminal cleavage/methylation domain-containing protein
MATNSNKIRKKIQDGFTMIELIAAMVLVSIMAPTMGLLVQSILRSMMVNNVMIQATEDAAYVIRNFTKHIDGVKTFTDGSLTATNLSFTSYADDATYSYQLRDGDRDLIYSRTDGTTETGALVNNVVVDSSDNDFDSKFIYRGHDNSDLIDSGVTPTNANIKSIELVFVLLKNKDTYKYNVYVLPDKEAHINETGLEI